MYDRQTIMGGREEGRIGGCLEFEGIYVDLEQSVMKWITVHTYECHNSMSVIVCLDCSIVIFAESSVCRIGHVLFVPLLCDFMVHPCFFVHSYLHLPDQFSNYSCLGPPASSFVQIASSGRHHRASSSYQHDDTSTST